MLCSARVTRRPRQAPETSRSPLTGPRNPLFPVAAVAREGCADVGDCGLTPGGRPSRQAEQQSEMVLEESERGIAALVMPLIANQVLLARVDFPTKKIVRASVVVLHRNDRPGDHRDPDAMSLRPAADLPACFG